MLIAKIKKHFSILFTRIKQSDTLSKMRLENDDTLTLIVNVFEQINSNKFSDENQDIFNRCEEYRASLLKNKSPIPYDIFGLNETKTVQYICEKATSQPIWAQFLFLITTKTKFPYLLEIGTNLGVSGTYIIEALKKKLKSKFITMEGIPELCEMASHQFKKITHQEKYRIIEGLYEFTFPDLMKENINFNILFIDGHHQKKPTLKYFQNLKSKLVFPAILIFDDINWSNEMQDTWETIKIDGQVCYSIDMFKWGIIILNNNKSHSPKHYKLHLSYS